MIVSQTNEIISIVINSSDISMFVETENRIQRHFTIAKDEENRREICLTWSGYIAALLEWNLITVDEHLSLTKLLMPILKPNDPVLDIFLGTKKDS